MYDLFDHVRYRDTDAIVVTKHEDGTVNVAFGTHYSDNSEGIWPVETAAHVDPEDLEPVEPDGDGVEVDDEATPEPDDVTIEGGATDDDVEEAVDDAEDDGEDGDDADDEGEWEEDFDAADFVDRTPMSEVVEDIETGLYDDHLDAIEAEADRVGVQEAVDARREA